VVTEISTTSEFDVDDRLDSVAVNGSSGTTWALEHGGEFISPGTGGGQSANAAKVKANVRAMTAHSFLRVFMVVSFGLVNCGCEFL